MYESKVTGNFKVYRQMYRQTSPTQYGHLSICGREATYGNQQILTYRNQQTQDLSFQQRQYPAVLFSGGSYWSTERQMM